MKSLARSILPLLLACVGPAVALAQTDERSAGTAAAEPDPLRYGDDERFVSVEPFLQIDGGYTDSRPRDVLGNERELSGEIRRARIYTDFGYDAFGGRVTIDFADLSGEAITYAYVNFAPTDALTIQAGHQKLPFSLEDLIGSRSLVFSESGANAALVPETSVGLAALYEAERGSLSGGVFGGTINHKAFDDGTTLAVRGTLAPYLSGDQAVHLGLGLLTRFDPRSLSFSGDTGISLAEIDLVSTGDFKRAERYAAANIEAGATVGRFFAQGELTVGTVRDGRRGTSAVAAGYLFAGLFLTDDRLPYDPGTGQFKGIEPQDPVDEGGLGAIQLAARIGFLDLDDTADVDNPAGTQIQAGAVGNWYLTDQLRLSADYTYTHIRSGEFEGADTHAALGRLWFVY